MITAVQSEKLIAEIKQDISDKEYTHDAVSFADVQSAMLFGEICRSDSLEENIWALHSSKIVSTTWALKSNRIFGSLIVLVKRCIRKSLQFIIRPIVTQQNEVNKTVEKIVADLYFDINSMKDRIEFLENENEKLKSMMHDNRMNSHNGAASSGSE
jgi:hypothetical protein